MPGLSTENAGGNGDFPVFFGKQGESRPRGSGFPVVHSMASAAVSTMGALRRRCFQHGHILGEHRGGLAALGVVPRVEQALLIAGDQAQLVGVVDGFLGPGGDAAVIRELEASSWGAMPPVMDCM